MLQEISKELVVDVKKGKNFNQNIEKVQKSISNMYKNISLLLNYVISNKVPLNLVRTNDVQLVYPFPPRGF